MSACSPYVAADAARTRLANSSTTHVAAFSPSVQRDTANWPRSTMPAPANACRSICDERARVQASGSKRARVLLTRIAITDRFSHRSTVSPRPSADMLVSSSETMTSSASRASTVAGLSERLAASTSSSMPERAHTGSTTYIVAADSYLLVASPQSLARAARRHDALHPRPGVVQDAERAGRRRFSPRPASHEMAHRHSLSRHLSSSLHSHGYSI